MRVLQRGGGPETAVAARNGVGFRNSAAFAVQRGVDALPVVAEVPDFAGRTVAPGDELSWVWFPERTLPEGRTEPEEADLDHFWDATAFSLDIVFDDGSRISDRAADAYGVALTPEAQDDARMQWVDQWNRRSVSLDGFVGRVIIRVEARLGRQDGAAPLPIRGWLDDVRIGRAAASSGPSGGPLDHVRTTRGSHASARFSRGNTAPLVAVPHGGVFGVPVTDASSATCPYAYLEHNRASDNRPALQAFATSHLPSPWIGDRGVFQIMPSPLAAPDTGREARALAFDHDTELDGPHRYRVSLEHGVDATMTAAEFALGFRFTFPEAGAAIILDHHGTVSDVTVRVEDGVALIDAVLDDRPETPPHSIHVRIGHAVADQTTVADGRLGGFVSVDGSAVVDVRIGVSTVSAADARANLDAAGDVDTMLTTAEALWNTKLDTVRVAGATDDQLVSLYSGLYRLFLFPNRAGETARDGVPRHRSFSGDVLTSPIRAGAGAEIVDAEISTTNGFWDTYRTAWPLLALLTPDSAAALADGFVQHFVESGWTPRWSAPGAQDSMTGTTSDTVFADLVARGVTGFDIVTAYRSAVRNATVPARDERVGRKGLHPGVFRGYVDTDTPEGMSWTLDAAINDWSVSVLATALLDRLTGERHADGADSVPPAAGVGADPVVEALAAAGYDADRLAAEAEWFARRSLQYRNVFDVERGFFIGRVSSGRWRVGDAFDPADWGDDYTETNAWGTMFTAPHDGAGVVALHDASGGFDAAIDRFFTTPETGVTSHAGSYGFAIHEMTEARDIRIGMLGLSNQPAHHIPFFPMFSGRHDDAHRIVRECVTRLFVGSDIGQGYPGDEDNGEMSAWYILATIGLYPLAPSTGSYVLVPPSVDRTELHLPGHATTVIEVAGPSRGPYVESVTVNGAPWNSVSIPHAVIAAGAHIVYQLADEPCGWASDSRPVSASAVHGYRDPAADALPADASPLTDDTGGSMVSLQRGATVEVPVTIGAAALYTVTVDEPGTFGWRIEWVRSDGTVTVADERDGAAFDQPHQTRVFSISGGVDGGLFRFVATTPVRLRQLELVRASRRR